MKLKDFTNSLHIAVGAEIFDRTSVALAAHRIGTTTGGNARLSHCVLLNLKWTNVLLSMKSNGSRSHRAAFLLSMVNWIHLVFVKRKRRLCVLVSVRPEQTSREGRWTLGSSAGSNRGSDA